MSVIPQIQRKRKLVDPEHADVPASKRVAVEVLNHGGDPSSSSAGGSSSAAPLPPAPAPAPKAPEKSPSLKEMMRNVAKPKRGRDRAGNGNGESAAKRIQSVVADKVGDARQEGPATVPRPGGLNLQLVLDADGNVSYAPESMVLDRQPEAYEVTEITDVVENGQSRRVTSASYAKRSNNTPWTTSEIDEFYRALRKCGSNFLMMASMLPGRDRKQVLKLYKKELKSHPERILYATTHPMEMTEDDVPTRAHVQPTPDAAMPADGLIEENVESDTGILADTAPEAAPKANGDSDADELDLAE